MSSINSVSNYWSSSSNFGTPKKTTTKATAGNVDPLTLYWALPAWEFQKAGSASPYWGRPASGFQKAGSAAPAFKIQKNSLDIQPTDFIAKPAFKIQKNSLDIQATDFIAKWDANQDEVLDFKEFKQSDGFTGNVKTNIGSAELAQALWAVVAGPDGTLSAAEYGRALLGMDQNADGFINQQESDKIKTQWATEANEDPGKANVSIYNRNVALGTKAGLDTKFGLGFEEKYAKSLEEDESSDLISTDLSTTNSITDSDDIVALLSSLGIDVTTTGTLEKAPASPPAETSTLPPEILALLKTLGLDTTSLTPPTTSTTDDENDYGFSAEVLATLREPVNLVDGLPVV
jgi:hypothetical protein